MHQLSNAAYGSKFFMLDSEHVFMRAYFPSNKDFRIYVVSTHDGRIFVYDKDIEIFQTLESRKAKIDENSGKHAKIVHATNLIKRLTADQLDEIIAAIAPDKIDRTIDQLNHYCD